MKKFRFWIAIMTVVLAMGFGACAVNNPSAEEILPAVKASAVQPFILAQLFRWGGATNSSVPYTLSSFSSYELTNIRTNYSFVLTNISVTNHITNIVTNIVSSTNFIDSTFTFLETNQQNSINTNIVVSTNIWSYAKIKLNYQIGGYSAVLDALVKIYGYYYKTNISVSVSNTHTNIILSLSSTNLGSPDSYYSNYVTNLTFITQYCKITTNVVGTNDLGLFYSNYSSFISAFSNTVLFSLTGTVSYTNSNVDGYAVYLKTVVSNYRIESGGGISLFTNVFNQQLPFNRSDNYMNSEGTTVNSEGKKTDFEVFYQTGLNMGMTGSQTNNYELPSGNLPGYVYLKGYPYYFNISYFYNTNYLASIKMDKYPDGLISINLIQGR